MTAVATPPDYQNINRQPWVQSNTPANGLPAMSADDVSRMLMPQRKPPPRSNSSSSISSVSSNSSTISNVSTGSTASNAAASSDVNSRKRPSRYLWPSSKSEPTAGISTARTQSMTSSSTQPAASAISALQNGSLNHSLGAASQNGVRGNMADNTPILYLTPLNGTFERKTISVPQHPEVIKIGRQTNAKTLPTPYNGYFDSKVLSRSHAEIWAERNGQIFIRDVKSSNGTFINGQRLSQENKDSEPKEISDGDSLELGIDIVSEDQKTVVHHKVAARVEHAGFVSSSTLIDLNLPVTELDNAFQSNQLVNQGMVHGRRKYAQGEVPPLRGQGGIQGLGQNNGPAQRAHIWLQPPNMEMAIKRLAAEYKLAQQQAHELQQSSSFLDNLINAGKANKTDSKPGSDEPRSHRNSMSISKDSSVKARFSIEPPNPPPQAPLPEKPSDLLAMLSSSKRNSFDKPSLLNGSPASPHLDSGASSQITALSEALLAARVEYDTQSKRLREMENMLVEERVKRENAEARAQKFEKRGRVVDTAAANTLTPSKSGAPEDNSPSTPIEDEATSEIGKKATGENAADKLRERFDLLLVELRELKQTAERWKREKEEAEQQRDAAHEEKKGLLDMVSQLRKEESERQSKSTRKQNKRNTRGGVSPSSKQQSASVAATAAADPDEPELDLEDDDDDATLVSSQTIKSHLFSALNGNAATSHLAGSHRGAAGMDTATKQAGGSSAAGATASGGQLMQAAPYLSAMSVVLVGVAIMAMINKMSNSEK